MILWITVLSLQRNSYKGERVKYLQKFIQIRHFHQIKLPYLIYNIYNLLWVSFGFIVGHWYRFWCETANRHCSWHHFQTQTALTTHRHPNSWYQRRRHDYFSKIFRFTSQAAGANFFYLFTIFPNLYLGIEYIIFGQILAEKVVQTTMYFLFRFFQ